MPERLPCRILISVLLTQRRDLMLGSFGIINTCQQAINGFLYVWECRATAPGTHCACFEHFLVTVINNWSSPSRSFWRALLWTPNHRLGRQRGLPLLWHADAAGMVDGGLVLIVRSRGRRRRGPPWAGQVIRMRRNQWPGGGAVSKLALVAPRTNSARGVPGTDTPGNARGRHPRRGRRANCWSSKVLTKLFEGTPRNAAAHIQPRQGSHGIYPPAREHARDPKVAGGVRMRTRAGALGGGDGK